MNVTRYRHNIENDVVKNTLKLFIREASQHLLHHKVSILVKQELIEHGVDFFDQIQSEANVLRNRNAFDKFFK